MQQDSVAIQPARLGFAVGALLTVGALCMVWAAFHDIAKGERDLAVEQTLLVCSAAWFLCLAFILIRVKHRILGLISVIAVGVGMWGEGAVGSTAAESLSPRLIAISAAFLWFLLLAGMLAFFSWRVGRKREESFDA